MRPILNTTKWLINTIFLIAGLAGILFFFVLTIQSWQKYQSRNWPSASAQIEHVKLQILTDSNAFIEYGYSYRVNGGVHVRNIEEKATKKSPLSAPQKARWQRYIDTQNITIYYNPSNVGKSLQNFERNPKLSDFIGFVLGAGLILLLGGAVCCFVAIEGFKANQVNRSALKASSIRKWFSGSLFSVLFTAAIFLFFGICAVVSWPVTQGLSLLSTHFFIPYASHSYVHLSGGTGDFPASVLGVASIPFKNMPNNLLAFIWALTLGVQLFNLTTDWANLPAKSRKGQSRRELIQQLLRLKFKYFIVYTAILLVLCLPGLRCYQIVTKEHIRYVDYFSSHEKSLPLSELKNIEVYQYGRVNGLIGWNFSFKNGVVLDITAPNKQALQQLLALPHVTSNLELRQGELLRKQSI